MTRIQYIVLQGEELEMYEENRRHTLSALEQRDVLAEQLFSSRDYEQTEGSLSFQNQRKFIDKSRSSHNRENL